MAAWIEMISDENASPELARCLNVARAPSGGVDNVMRVHSLRPHTMEGHHKLYMSVLHNAGNTLPLWLSEIIASYVSILNSCDYSLANHFANARHLLADDRRADDILNALQADSPEKVFSGKELAMLRYARKLTLDVGGMQESDVELLRNEGVPDGEILEVNQVTGYFNYVNRLLNGLGVSLAGDVVGYYGDGDDREKKE